MVDSLPDQFHDLQAQELEQVAEHLAYWLSDEFGLRTRTEKELVKLQDDPDEINISVLLYNAESEGVRTNIEQIAELLQDPAKLVPASEPVEMKIYVGTYLDE